MTLVCPKCQRSVEAIKVFQRDPKTKKMWIITQCPHDRCKWNFTLEEYNEIKRRP